MYYAAYTDKPNNETYILKHLAEADALIAVDYPQKAELLLGIDGFIKIADLVDINPEIKFIHFAGKVEANSIRFGGISYFPEILVPNSINVNLNEIGLRMLVDCTVASMKAAALLIKSKNRTIHPDESIVLYEIINADGPVVLGKVMF